MNPDFRIDSQQPECTYTGTWTQNQTDNTSRNTIKYATTNEKNAALTITADIAFTDAVIFGYGNVDAGIVNVYVDGVLNQTVDCYLVTGAAMKNLAIVRLTGLKKDKHVIKLECTGTKSDSSSGTIIGFNYIYLMDPDIPLLQRDKAVLWVGDSISDANYSFTDSPMKAILNNNFSGNTIKHTYCTRPSGTSDVLRFVENEIIAKRSSFVSCLLGTNDLTNETNTKGNLSLLIDVCRKYKLPLQICTITPRTGGYDSKVNAMSSMIRFLCFSNNIPCIDFNAGVFNGVASAGGLFQGDGLHPSVVGHSIMARFIFKQMLKPGNPFRSIFIN